MKKLLIILFFTGFSAFGQTPNSTQKGYYLQMIGDSVVGQNTRPDKAFFDLYNYMKERKIKNGTVTSPYWEITVDYSDMPSGTTDTIYIDNTIPSNPWMGEPIIVDQGTIISDQDASNPDTKPEKAFDNDINTYAEQAKHNLGWIGREYATEVEVDGFGFLPRQLAADAIKMNKAQIQYRNTSGNWRTIYTINGIDETNFMNWIRVDFTPVKAKAFRIIAQQTGAFTRVAELYFKQTY